jgi:FMN reductase
MTQANLILLAGSPSVQSRSWLLLQGIERRVREAGVTTRSYSVRDFPAESLLLADADQPDVKQLVEHAKAAQGIVVSTPVYKATYAGALKTLLDVIPPDALVNKLALSIATARIGAHLPGTASALRSIYEFFRIGTLIPEVLLVDDAVFADRAKGTLSQAAERALDIAATAVLDSLLR